MKRRKFMATALTAGIASAATPAGSTGMTLSGSGAAGHQSGKKPRVMFYHDSRHPAIYMYEPPMQKEEFEAAVDELVGTDIDALMFNLADGRTMFHDTKAGEVWGHWVKKWPHMIFRRAGRNVKMMLDSATDFESKAYKDAKLNYDMVNGDAGFGMHNPLYAQALLNYALTLEPEIIK